MPDYRETRVAHLERRYIFSPAIIIEGKSISVGSLMERLGPPWNNEHVPRVLVLPGIAPISTAKQLHSNLHLPFPHPLLLSRENTPAAPCLLCKFCQTGVESACQVEKRHMLAFPSTCCLPRGFLEHCLLASEELELLSPPPFPLTKTTRNNN